MSVTSTPPISSFTTAVVAENPKSKRPHSSSAQTAKEMQDTLQASALADANESGVRRQVMLAGFLGLTALALLGFGLAGNFGAMPIDPTTIKVLLGTSLGAAIVGGILAGSSRPRYDLDDPKLVKLSDPTKTETKKESDEIKA